ncbi:galactokinase [Corynebacterium heidelbergense]|uniref:Galactokinase n=1 Tax=Corynebacterium heidelbergense TaxID=2055947 RepID=A0A364VAE9_9CORY|nr:galactokinase [Corynebacterium heidelbergense]RAV33640.1 galactokinase [Corynebacterium heidelbergense]WCZ37520.1 Galactokinase [Corynebacterium heidelbergense]
MASINWISTRPAERASADVNTLFVREYGHKPAGVWSAPGRVNLIGEHVDYAGGISVPFALSQRTCVAVKQNNMGSYRIVSRIGKPEEIQRFTISVSDVGPGRPQNWAGYALGAVWAGVEEGAIDPALGGLDIAVESDVPVGAGLSSSAALECSTALAAAELVGAEKADRTALMRACIRAENEVVGASTGGLDQQISLFGRAGHALAIDFSQATARHIPFDIALRDLSILIVNTRAPHSLADGQYAARRRVIDGVTSSLGVDSLRFAEDAVARAAEWAAAHGPSPDEPIVDSELDWWRGVVARRVRHVVTEIDRTERAIAQLEAGDLHEFGASMLASHASLRDDYEVTIPELDLAVAEAMDGGAWGARMTGGGFGGSVIALLPRDRVEQAANSIYEAFGKRDFNVPEFAVAVPGDGARRER